MTTQTDPDFVTICECFARDGLQHEPAFVPTATKSMLLDAFFDAGFSRIEATSYASPERLPAFRDASEVLSGLRRAPGVSYKATCPNARAVERALADLDAGHGADELSLLVSASESHSRRNLGTSRAEQWSKVVEMVELAAGRFRLVGVISVAFGCPFEGAVDTAVVDSDFARFADLGVDLVTVGDTTGVATPPMVKEVFAGLAAGYPTVPAVAHFHDTRGTAIANCVAALEVGCRHLDSSFGGIGGHPSKIEYGAGDTGNVCTEDVVDLLAAMGVATGLDRDRVAVASRLAEEALGRSLGSRVAKAGPRPEGGGVWEHA